MTIKNPLTAKTGKKEYYLRLIRMDANSSKRFHLKKDVLPICEDLSDFKTMQF